VVLEKLDDGLLASVVFEHLSECHGRVSASRVNISAYLKMPYT
jgi:hypothetical protein